MCNGSGEKTPPPKRPRRTCEGGGPRHRKGGARGVEAVARETRKSRCLGVGERILPPKRPSVTRTGVGKGIPPPGRPNVVRKGVSGKTPQPKSPTDVTRIGGGERVLPSE